ncbi:MAG: hypothetical protein U1E65_25990 [Myxococcota bacterium]
MRETVGIAGGAISIPGASGTLAIEIPAGALAGDVRFEITPLAAGEFRFLPLDVELKLPATLRFTAKAEVAERTAFYWQLGDAHSFLKSARAGLVLSATVDRLAPGPLTTDNGLRAAANGDGSTLGSAPIDCAAENGRLTAALQNAANQEIVGRIIATSDALEALKDACAVQTIQQAMGQACANYDAAKTAAEAAVISDESVFEGVVHRLVGAQAQVEAVGASCDISGTSSALDGLFDKLIATVTMRVREDAFQQEFVERRLKGLIRIQQACNLMDVSAAICEKFPLQLYPPIFDILRDQAYQDCLDEGTGLSLSQLFSAGGPVNSGPFLLSGHFSYENLEDDIHFCTDSNLELKVFKDADTVPEELVDRAQHLSTRGQKGAPNNSFSVTVPRSGSVTLTGELRALVCPNAQLSSDELVFRVGNIELGRRPQQGNVYALGTAPFELVLRRDAVALGLDPEKVADLKVDVFREGAACGNAFSTSHQLLTLRVHVEGGAKLEISPTSTTLGKGEALQFTASLDGAATTDVQWTADGGSISATGNYTAPMQAGTFHVRAALSASPQLTATATVTVREVSGMAVRWGGTIDVSANYTFAWDGHLTSGCFFSSAMCDRHLSGNGSGTMTYSFEVESLDVVPEGLNVRFQTIRVTSSSGNMAMTQSIDERSSGGGCDAQFTGTTSFDYRLSAPPTNVWFINAQPTEIFVSLATFERGSVHAGTFSGSGHTSKSAQCQGGPQDSGSTTPMTPAPQALVGFLGGMNLTHAPGSINMNRIRGSAQASNDGTANNCTGALVDTPHPPSTTCHQELLVTWDLHPL